jgi:hypothetical protein
MSLMDPNNNRPLLIDYESVQEDRTIGSSPFVRIVSGTAAVGLLGLIGYFIACSRRTLGGLDDYLMPIVAALGGACYCSLVALDVAGRTKPRPVDRIGWLGIAGVVVSPWILVATAFAMIENVLADPYARTRDYLGWFGAAGTLIVLAAWLCCYAVYLLLQWRRKRASISRSPSKDG